MGFLTHMQLVEGQGATWTSINSISLSLVLECTILMRPRVDVTAQTVRRAEEPQKHQPLHSTRVGESQGAQVLAALDHVHGELTAR